MAAPSAPPAIRPQTIAALLGLTFATGIIDAASVLGPGRAFTANMTGNVVFLGFALAGRGVTSVAHGIMALAAFLAGAAIAGRILVRPVAGRMRASLGLELVAIAASAAAALSPTAVRPVIVLLAFAMGMRNAIVRKLAVPDLTTTVLTLTLTGLAADSRVAGGTNPRWGRRVLATLCMLGGALLGARILDCGLAATLGAALLAEVASMALLLPHAARASAAGAG